MKHLTGYEACFSFYGRDGFLRSCPIFPRLCMRLCYRAKATMVGLPTWAEAGTKRAQMDNKPANRR